MKSLTSLLALTGCFGSLAPAAFALTFGGTITQTVTGSNDPLYTVGQTFEGYYRYESTTTDGTFFTPFYNSGANESLTGSVYMAFSPRPGEFPLMGFNPLTNTPILGQLVVSGGQITSFNWSFDHGGYYTGMDTRFGTFWSLSYYDRPIYLPDSGQFLPTPIVQGTLSLSEPRKVPDTMPTDWMLFACVSSLSFLAWKFRS